MQKNWHEMLWRADWILAGAVFSLSVIGLLMIYGIGTSYETITLAQFNKQITALVIGIAGAIVLAVFDFRQLKSFGVVAYILGLVLLIGVLLFGETVRGTQGWFKIGTITIQPVELAKIMFAIFTASYFAKLVHKRLTWLAFAGSGAAMAVYVGLILLQPDFGSAMVIVAMWFAGIAFAGLRGKAWLVIIGVTGIVVALSWTFFLQPYQKARITSFMNPESDPLGAGYNVIQSQTAIGSGGLFGKGLGEGSQSRLRFLPEASTDFMFAVMGEELGFVGLNVCLLLFGIMLYRIIIIGYKANDVFAGVFAIMIAGMFGMHILVNAGMNMGIMPVTGIPLPFASAAASALVAGYLAIGIMQSISIYGEKSLA